MMAHQLGGEVRIKQVDVGSTARGPENEEVILMTKEPGPPSAPALGSSQRGQRRTTPPSDSVGMMETLLPVLEPRGSVL